MLVSWLCRSFSPNKRMKRDAATLEEFSWKNSKEMFVTPNKLEAHFHVVIAGFAAGFAIQEPVGAEAYAFQRIA